MCEQHGNYLEHFLVYVSAVSAFVSISTFASLVGITVGSITSSVGLNIWALTAEIKGYKSIIKKRKKHGNIVVLAKTSNLGEYNEMKEEIKNRESSVEYIKILET